MRPRLGAIFAILLAMTSSVRAESTSHWAYQPVRRPALPAVRNTAWPRNALDYFILSQLEAKGLAPTSEAPRARLLRRASFDLNGLPPDSAALARFDADARPDAYERELERFVHSPRYGERMASHWLDLARYADTHGYYVDSHREMWRYRDEVVSAFNRHQPFDQFTVEQLAGDLLPGATLSQQIASGFNRNHMINFEPGAIPEEYQNEYVVDRVVTTATVWLGQTIQCAQCHDHKYDPFTMQDFYALAAFFNNVPEEGLDGRRGNAVPYISAPTPSQQIELAKVEQQIDDLNRLLQARRDASAADQLAWEDSLRAGKQRLPALPADTIVYFAFDESDGQQARNAAVPSSDGRSIGRIDGTPLWTSGKLDNGLLFDGETSLDAGNIAGFTTRDRFTVAAWAFPTTTDEMSILAHGELEGNRRGYELYLNGGKLCLALRHKHPDEVSVVTTSQPLKTSKWQHIAATYDGSGEAAGIALYIDGAPQEVIVPTDRLARGPIDTAEQTLRVGGISERAFRGMLDELRIYGRLLTPGEIGLLADANPVMQIVAISTDQRTQRQQRQLRDFYLEHHDAIYRGLLQRRQDTADARRRLIAASPTSMVMAERHERRPTFVLERGDYRRPGEEITPATPAIWPPLPASAPANRLTLARWLVDGRHPLTARVAVNRLWQMHFGHGLVRTPEDFGARGDSPTNPELLDWLADEFVRSGWSIQHIQRLIMTSATYRQDSCATADRRHIDPENRLLSWFPRTRLPAEMLRDQALATGGLLHGEMYGPSVFPYQPSGLWEEIGIVGGEFTSQSYVASKGADLYRRSLYTFWKRTAPAPNMAVFDAADRQVCTVARGSTNTPLQALVLWNDPTFVEAARQIAARLLSQQLPVEHRMPVLFAEIVGRAATPDEIAVLHRLLARQRALYRSDNDAAARLVAVGDTPPDKSLPAEDLAAWTCIAQAILTLDEVLSRN